MPKKSNWLKHDIRVAALIYQAVSPGVLYTDEDIRVTVNQLFPRALIGLGRIRHGRLLLERIGYLRRDPISTKYQISLRLLSRTCSKLQAR